VPALSCVYHYYVATQTWWYSSGDLNSPLHRSESPAVGFWGVCSVYYWIIGPRGQKPEELLCSRMSLTIARLLYRSYRALIQIVSTKWSRSPTGETDNLMTECSSMIVTQSLSAKSRYWESKSPAR
jgi:hypothetical protein